MSASVAQGIEQRFPVPCVGGSNPSRRVFATWHAAAGRTGAGKGKPLLRCEVEVFLLTEHINN